MRQPANSTVYKEAEALKAEGNALFSRAKYGAALDKYTEAITLCPDMTVLYVNRAMCHKKRNDYQQVEGDAARALELDKDNMKAHYLLGSAFYERKVYDKAIYHLTKALEAAREHNDAIKDDIWHALAHAKYALWEVQAAERAAARKDLQDLLQGLQPAAEAAPLPAGFPLQAGGQQPTSHIKASNAQVTELVGQLHALLDQAAARDRSQEVPSTFTCPLTMEVFRDPVITPAGHSYERAALLEHLQKVGKFDPVNRSVRVTEDMLIPNLHLRSAVSLYLDEHPYAWKECR